MLVSKRPTLPANPNFLILVCCLLLNACSSPQITVGQTPEELEVRREAEQLLRGAAESLASGAYDQTLEKSKKVAELLPKDWRVQQRAAELLYLSGNVKESVSVFDQANELEPKLVAKNWQRGIALATNGDFKRGAEQFKLHREVNPDDVENSAWYFLCVAKSQGLDAAKKEVIPSRGDPRQPMMEILQMLKGEKTPEQVLLVAENVGPSIEQKRSAQFYADLYVGLYYDSADRNEDAVKHIKRCLEYGTEGYMAETARVYLEARFKKSKDSDTDRQR